ncbi:MAG: hypothetical protein PSN37_02005 [Alphaproteobacteria bacterium]|nr:hypothetical protein [Alphaproteobacteria bacterium]
MQVIGTRIVYIDDVSIVLAETEIVFDHKAITREIEVSKSGQKGKMIQRVSLVQ